MLLNVHYTTFLCEVILHIDGKKPPLAPCWKKKKSCCGRVCCLALQWRGMKGLPVPPKLPPNRKASVHRADNKICSIKPLINKLLLLSAGTNRLSRHPSWSVFHGKPTTTSTNAGPQLFTTLAAC